ncbi:foldase protein PrsA [Massilia sp. TSP1-1-2]|uniref:foldase protein PrsA n=1 Tax=unclassified Massilia TaxID=2609279 RepID=UPI003CF15958
MTFKPARLLLALIAVVAMPAFAQNVAVVNGKAIPMSRVEATVKQVEAQGQQKDSPELRDMIKKDLIAREVMMQEALKQGYDKNEIVKQQLDGERQRLVVSAMMRDYADKHKVTDAEIKTEYDRIKAQAGDKEYHIRHIVAETDAEAKAIIGKLKGGAKFEDLAKTSKDAGSAATGGDLDWVTPSESFPKEFSEAFTALQKGAVTQAPVQTPIGFHVIKLDDTRALKFPSLEEAKPQIAEGLTRKKVQAYQEQLAKKATISIK